MNKEDKYEHGMKVPEGYFDSIEERLASKLSEDQLPKDTGFTTPDDYFATFEETLLRKVNETPVVKVIPLYKRKAVLYAVSIAACLLVSISLFYPSVEDTTAPNLAELEAYYEAGNISYDTQDIALLLTDTDLEALPVADEEVSLENLENYLLENLDDNTLLIE